MNTPRINPNDPQWTAFVLGELDDDRDAVDHLLDASPEARALVEELKVASAAIEQALENGDPLQLTAAQRAAVRRAAESQPSVSVWLRPLWGWAAAAAVLGVAVIAVVLLQPLSLSRSAKVVNVKPFAVSSPGTAPAGSSASAAAAPPITAMPGSLGKGVTVTGSLSVIDAQKARRVPGFISPLPDRALVGARFRPPTTGTESYTAIVENNFIRASEEPLATFSIDVDTASYSNVRRFLNQAQLPPRDAVRIEELVNYFTYDYPSPAGNAPIGASIATAAAPWNPEHSLVRIGVKSRQIDAARRPPSNLVFLVDVSGSMNMPQKLPLLKSALKLLVDQLGESDMVSIVTYASGTRVALTPTTGDRKDVIVRTIDDLQAGGSTNGSAGIQLAYTQATAGFIRRGTNRVILMTDGDFNVGISDAGELTRLIEEKAKSGVFLSVLGFGMGNLKDSTMERLADRGNGHYAYIDTLAEARKVLVEQMSATLVTVAKDVKIQVDFNPAKVEAYRLIGYENRALRPEDFNDDRKDAGEMGAGQTVTALFEIVPHGGAIPGSIDPSVFQPAPRPAAPPTSRSNDLLVLRMRYTLPEASESTRMDVPFADRSLAFASADDDFRFAAAVAAFGMLLRDSQYKGDATLDWVKGIAAASQGKDPGGYRDEFVSLVQRAIILERTSRVQQELERRRGLPPTDFR
jgi:Ca-activated chloride channel homolog